MDKLKKIIISITAFAVGITPVLAECTTSELNQLRSEAYQVKADYDALTRVLDESEYTPPDGVDINEEYVAIVDYFEIQISNLTDNLYVTVDSNVIDSATYTYQDSENGIITIEVKDLSKIGKYTITVYSSDSTNCPDTKLYETTLTTPRFNDYSELEVCSNASEFYLCYKFVSTEEVDFNTLVKQVEAYKAGKVNNQGGEITEEEPTKGFGDFIKENKVSIIIGVSLIVAIGVAVVVIVIKKQGGKKNEDNI